MTNQEENNVKILDFQYYLIIIIIIITVFVSLWIINATLVQL